MTQTAYTVPGDAGNAAVINNTTGSPHQWMTPEGFYIDESSSGTAQTNNVAVIMGGS
jgi:hypothetical protein